MANLEPHRTATCFKCEKKCHVEKICILPGKNLCLSCMIKEKLLAFLKLQRLKQYTYKGRGISPEPKKELPPVPYLCKKPL